MTSTAFRVVRPLRWRWPNGRSVRTRLTLLYGGLFLLAGVALLTITYLLVDHTTASALFVNSQHGQVAIKAPPTGSSPSGGVALRQGNPTPQELQIAHHLLGQARAQHDHDLHQLLTQSGIALGIMAVVAIALGWVMAGRVLRPLRSMTNATQQITERNLHERLELRGPNDELKNLADTIDGLVARLEKAFDAQKRFVANASHELRTPLALNRTLLEVSLADRQAGVPELRSVLGDLLASAQDQERLIDAMLTLASSERGLDKRDAVDLAALTDRVVALRHGVADQRHVELEATLQPASTTGNPYLIERLIANLVDNAIQHNTSGGRIDIETATRQGEAVLRVVNTGPTIDPNAVDRLFQPFERLEDNRASHPDGHGLGLSIVRAIAMAHDAKLKVLLGEQGGLDVRVHFPHPTDGTTTRHSADRQPTRRSRSPVTHTAER